MCGKTDLDAAMFCVQVSPSMVVDLAGASPTASPETAPMSQAPQQGVPLPNPPPRDMCSGLERSSVQQQQQLPSLPYLPYNITANTDDTSFLQLLNVDDEMVSAGIGSVKNTDNSGIVHIPTMSSRGMGSTYQVPSIAGRLLETDGEIPYMGPPPEAPAYLPGIKLESQSRGRSSRDSRSTRNKGTGRFMCQTCKTTYGRHDNLMRHIRLECGKEALFHCPLCKYSAKRKFSLIRHLRRSH